MVINKKIYRILFFLFFILSLPLHFSSIITRAEKPDVKMTKGVISFITKDTTATTGIRWKTEGFIVKSEKTNGFPMNGLYGRFSMDVHTSITNGAYTYSQFTFDESLVIEQFKKAGINKSTLDKSGGYVYLNGITQVYEHGIPTGEYYYVLYKGKDNKGKYYKSIMEARPWKNPFDFYDYFDLKLKYNPSFQEISIQFQEINNNEKTVIETIKYPPQSANSDFLINDTLIPEKKNSLKTKKDYYLYRVYYLNTKNTSNVNSILNGEKKGDLKTDVNPLKDKQSYRLDLDRIRERKIEVEAGGIQIVAVYKQFKESTIPPYKEEETEITQIITDEIEQELLDPIPIGIIGADNRGSEQFNVTEGIPTTESLYANIFSQQYLVDYLFQKIEGKKVYPVTVQRTYYLSWSTSESGPDDEDGNPTTITVWHSDTRTVNHNYQIKRKYCYWHIQNLNMYKVWNAQLSNYALPNGKIILDANSTIPNISYTETKQHIIEPMIRVVTLPSVSISGTSIPTENWESEAESSVSQIQVRNDELKFNNITYMSNEIKDKETEKPKRLPVCTTKITENTLYCDNMIIDRAKRNGDYNSEGIIRYKSVLSIGESEGSVLQYDIDEVNNVIIHTPVICDAQIENKKMNNQMILPDITVASLILDRSFNITIPTVGQHNFIRGYGYRDYSKYIYKRQVKFPFDSYQGTTYYEKNTWITISKDTEQFYLPIWVEENYYSVEFRSISINCYINNMIQREEALANCEYENYIATKKLFVQVSGRVYGLELYDISDYPIWEEVFRKKNSLSLSGFTYKVGIRDQNGQLTGQKEKNTLSLINGSHPNYNNMGTIKTGYVTRFRLKTIGTMYGTNDKIQIKPTFYYIDKKGGKRQEVDLYYTETIQGKKQKLVKAGSTLDQKNIKSFYINDKYLSIPNSEIEMKASIENTSLNTIKTKRNLLFTFKNIVIPDGLRTYIGTNYTPTKTVPASVDAKEVTRSMQQWYCEYYLPSEVHIVKKDYDVASYAKNHGIDYKENFWLKDGYIVVNFTIETIKDGKRHLSYLNLDNHLNDYCNMWRTEGYLYEKIDDKGNKFKFKDGDFVLYDTNKSASTDYIRGGTH